MSQGKPRPFLRPAMTAAKAKLRLKYECPLPVSAGIIAKVAYRIDIETAAGWRVYAVEETIADAELALAQLHRETRRLGREKNWTHAQLVECRFT